MNKLIIVGLLLSILLLSGCNTLQCIDVNSIKQENRCSNVCHPYGWEPDHKQTRDLGNNVTCVCVKRE